MGWWGAPKESRKSKPSDKDFEEDEDEDEEEEEDDYDAEEEPERTCTFQTNYGEFDDDDIYRGEKREGWNCNLTQNQDGRCRKEICPFWNNGFRKTNN